MAPTKDHATHLLKHRFTNACCVVCAYEDMCCYICDSDLCDMVSMVCIDE